MKAVKKCAAVLALAAVLVGMTGCEKSKDQNYEAAKNLYFYGQYSEARKAFKDLGDYLDSQAMVTSCDYQLAMKQLSEGEYLGASAAFGALGEYGNAKGLAKAAEQLAALEQYNSGDTAGALKVWQGSKLAGDLENGQESQQELKDVTGTWSCMLDGAPYFKKELEVLAEGQKLFAKDFCKDFAFKDLSIKLELKIDENGLAVMTLAEEDLEGLKKSAWSQFHDSFVTFYDGVVANEIEEMEISREEFMGNYGVSDNAGVFKIDYKMSMEDFEKQLDPAKAADSIKETFSGSGATETKEEAVFIYFPNSQWEVTPKDGRLSLTAGETTLTFTKLPQSN